LRTTGHPGEAVDQLRAAVRLAPGAAEPMLALAWALATEPDRQLRDPGTAVRLARDAIAVMAPPDARALATLAAAHAAAGDFDAALTRGREALDLARRTGDATMVLGIDAHLELYRARRPYLVRP
jgi:Flp pilus assembly protein TadD